VVGVCHMHSSTRNSYKISLRKTLREYVRLSFDGGED
jgi:hypothetical protein